MHSKATDKDDEQVFIAADAPDEVSTSSSATAKHINIAHFEQSVQHLVINKVVTDEFDIDEDMIKLLGSFLGVRDYKTNLLSSWILRTIAEQLINASNKINTRDYSTFVLWLHEEINIIFNNPDMRREQFFELMSNVFHQTLSEILDGKGILLPSQFLYQQNKIGTEFIESSSSTTESDNNSVSIVANSNMEQVEGNTSFQRKSMEFINLDEEFLNTIIDSTYQIFGTQLNYMLIQAAYKKQKDIDYYMIPYHFRNPRVIKNIELSRQPSTISNLKNEKTKKKRKSSMKNSVEEMREITKSTSVFDINQFRFILPLSEALEANNIMHSYENSEIETNSNVY